jgi:hypothetical protein
MLNRDQVVRQVSRVLKRGGVFILLAPNGRYCWYTLLAPFRGVRPVIYLQIDFLIAGMPSVFYNSRASG